MKKLTAVVLAGSRAGGDPLADYAGVSHKALIEVGGRAMTERVVGALAEVDEIARIVIVIERPEILDALPALRDAARGKELLTLPAAAGPSASVAVALEREGTPLLVTTADHALLRAEWVREFLSACPPAADAIVALARRAAVMKAVPDTQRTWLRFSNGDFSGCNLFLLRSPAASGVVKLWQLIEAERKRPMRMIRRLGFGYALAYLAHRLSLDAALARLGALSGSRIGYAELRDGRAAIDVDKPADLDLVRRLIA